LMPEVNGGSPQPPEDRQALIKYLEEAVELTEAQDATAVYLLRLLISILRGENTEHRR
jgi:hypothetical protein